MDWDNKHYTPFVMMTILLGYFKHKHACLKYVLHSCLCSKLLSNTSAFSSHTSAFSSRVSTKNTSYSEYSTTCTFYLLYSVSSVILISSEFVLKSPLTGESGTTIGRAADIDATEVDVVEDVMEDVVTVLVSDFEALEEGIAVLVNNTEGLEDGVAVLVIDGDALAEGIAVLVNDAEALEDGVAALVDGVVVPVDGAEYFF